MTGQHLLRQFPGLADIKAANQKHHNDQLNRSMQNFMYSALEDSHEGGAKKALAVLTELWRRQIWRDARTANVIGVANIHILSHKQIEISKGVDLMQVSTGVLSATFSPALVVSEPRSC